MYLTQGLHRSLQRQPDRLALTHVEAQAEPDGHAQRRTSFAELHASVARQAAVWIHAGLKPGDRVALLAANSDRLVQALLACWWAGLVACPLNTRWSAAEVAHALADSDSSLLVHDEALHPLADEALARQAQAARRTALPSQSLEQWALQASPRADLQPLEDTRTGGESLAVLLYTGGTTGRAKGVKLSHANLWSASIARAAELPNSPDSVSLLVAPLFHVAGLGRLVGQTIAGGACVTLAQFKTAAVLDVIERQRISDIIVVPTMLQALLDDPGFDASKLQSLDRIAFGAAPMPPDLLDRALAAWPQAEFFQAYGLTETAGAVCINGPSNHRSATARASGRLNAVGHAGLGAEVIVADPEGRALPVGEVGEVLCRGPMVTPGYWRNEQATQDAMVQGWFKTGDAGRMQADGSLSIVDRLKDMIISGGENIYGVEVETALRAHADVAQAAVVGAPDAHWGEHVHAFVVLREGSALAAAAQAQQVAQLQALCRSQLAGFKCPRAFSFVTSLPLSAAGKVLKQDLRERVRHGRQ